MSRSILIIGAERGLGLGLARIFFNSGWNVTATARTGDDCADLVAVGSSDPARLSVAYIDVTRAEQIPEFKTRLGDSAFDIVFLVAGIYGPLHNSVLEASDDELLHIMLTNCFGPARLARHLLNRLVYPGGTLAFMSSHRASIEMNVEPKLPLELYRASKVALNMLARGIYADHAAEGLTVLSLHPGWVATAMGTLDGTVEAEIEVEESVNGLYRVLDQHAGSGENLYIDWTGAKLPW